MAIPSIEQLHWNQLRKQYLLDEKVDSFYDIAKTQLGLHSTDYWTPYFSVWARIGDFNAKKMFDSLNNGQKLVRTHAFRTTVHVIHSDNLSLIINATGPSLYRTCREDKYRKVDQLSDGEIEAILNRVRDALKDGPLQTSELKRAIPESGEHIRSALLMLMARGEVVRAKALHARSNLTSYALVERWLNRFNLKVLDEKEAITELIQRHIERFGPVSINDIAWWLRQTKTTVRTSISKLGDSIVNINLEGAEKYLSRADYEVASTIEKPHDECVWFLPYEDHFLKAYIERKNFIDQVIQSKIFPADRKNFWPSNPAAPVRTPSRTMSATGEVRPSIWLDGRVIGRWEMDDDADQKRVVMSLYEKASKSQTERIEEVRAHLEDFVNLTMLPISGT